jgi:hypothetical protein
VLLHRFIQKPILIFICGMLELVRGLGRLHTRHSGVVVLLARQLSKGDQA